MDITVSNLLRKAERIVQAIEFNTKDEYDAYMKEHPGANPQNHSVKSQDKKDESTSVKDDSKDIFKNRDEIFEKNLPNVDANIKNMLKQVGIDPSKAKLVDQQLLLFTDQAANSNKFHNFSIYELENGTHVLMNSYGRVGSNGKPQILMFNADLNSAKEMMKKALDAKKGKGYKDYVKSESVDMPIDDSEKAPAPQNGASQHEETKTEESHPYFNDELITKLEGAKDTYGNPEFSNKLKDIKNAPDSFIKKCLDNPEINKKMDGDVRKNILLSNSISDDVKIQVFKDKNTKIDNYDLERIAQSDKAPLEVVKALAFNRIVSIKAAALSNPKMPADILNKKADESFADVKLAVAKNPNTPIEALNRLAVTNLHNPTYSPAYAAVLNPNADQSTVDAFMSRVYVPSKNPGYGNPTREQREAHFNGRYNLITTASKLIDKGMLSEDQVDQVLKMTNFVKEGSFSSAKNSNFFNNCSSNYVNNFVSEFINDNKTYVSRECKLAAVRSTKVDKGLLNKLLDNPGDNIGLVKFAVSNSQFTSDELDGLIKSDKYDSIKQNIAVGVAKNPNASSDTIKYMVDNLSSYDNVSQKVENGVVVSETRINVVVPFLAHSKNISEEDCIKLLNSDTYKSNKYVVIQNSDFYDNDSYHKSNVYDLTASSLGSKRGFSDAYYEKLMKVFPGYTCSNPDVPANAIVEFANGFNDSDISNIADGYYKSYRPVLSNPACPAMVAKRVFTKYKNALSAGTHSMNDDHSYRPDDVNSVPDYMLKNNNLPANILSYMTDYFTGTHKESRDYYGGSRVVDVQNYSGSNIFKRIVNHRNTNDATISKIRDYAVKNNLTSLVDEVDNVTRLRNNKELDFSKMSPELREKVKNMSPEELQKFIGWLKNR